MIKYCSKCKEYTLKNKCSKCGGIADNSKPARFKPNQDYSKERLKVKKLL